MCKYLHVLSGIDLNLIRLANLIPRHCYIDMTSIRAVKITDVRRQEYESLGLFHATRNTNKRRYSSSHIESVYIQLT